jgi:hypothetical protein
MGRIQRDFIFFVFGRRGRRRDGSWRFMMDYLWHHRLMVLNMMLNRFLIELWQMSAKFACR